MPKNIPLNFLSPPIPDHRLDTSSGSKATSLNDRIQSALAEHQSELQQSSLHDMVEKIESVFPVQVEAYEDVCSKLVEAEESSRARRRRDEVEQTLKSFDTRLLAAWEELVSMGKINLEGLRAMVHGEAEDPLMDSAVWPEGFDSLDYNHGSGSGGEFIGSAKHESFIGTTLPIVRERVGSLVAAANDWGIANTEAAAYLAEVLDEDKPVDLEQ